MNNHTSKQLKKLNQHFYQQIAASFSQTRQHPNPGWSQLTPLLNTIHTKSTPIHVTDLACGNGRFLSWLNSQQLNISYTGIDTDTQLLNIAAQQHPQATFLHQDILGLQPLTPTPNLISAFGLTHHLPGSEFRRQWFTHYANQLSPSGLFIYTYWQIDTDPRFQKATTHIDIPEQNIHLTADQLEAGDVFLRWQERTDIARYVHIYSEVEKQTIAQALTEQGLHLIQRYASDGKSNQLNDYWVWQKTPAY